MTDNLCPGCQTCSNDKKECFNCESIENCVSRYDSCCTTSIRNGNMKCDEIFCPKRYNCLCYNAFILNPPKIEEIEVRKNEQKYKNNDSWYIDYIFELIIGEINKSTRNNKRK